MRFMMRLSGLVIFFGAVPGLEQGDVALAALGPAVRAARGPIVVTAFALGVSVTLVLLQAVAGLSRVPRSPGPAAGGSVGQMANALLLTADLCSRPPCRLCSQSMGSTCGTL